MEKKANWLEGGFALGCSIVGGFLLFKHRPIGSAQDLINRGIIDPNFYVLKEEYFYGGIIVAVMLFIYSLWQLRIIK